MAVHSVAARVVLLNCFVLFWSRGCGGDNETGRDPVPKQNATQRFVLPLYAFGF